MIEKEIEKLCKEIGNLAGENPDHVAIDQTYEGFRSTIEVHNKILYFSDFHSTIKESLISLKQKVVDKEQYKG